MNLEKKHSIIDKLFKIFGGLTLLSCLLMFIFGFVLNKIVEALVCIPIALFSVIIYTIFICWESSLKEKMEKAKKGKG